MKKVYFALIALALAAVSCDKRQPEDPNPLVPETGAQVYIDNAKTTFYVKTAEEKAAKKESLAALTGKRFATLDTPTDDSEIALPIIRKNASGEYDCEVNIYMGSNFGLFTVTNISYENDGVETKVPVSLVPVDFDGDKKDDGGTVKFTFPDEIEKVNVLIGFDIRNGISANVDYKFEAWLGDEVEGTAFGANDFSFIIKHAIEVHLPYITIGSVTIDDTNFWYGVGPYSNLVLQVHEEDLDPNCLTVGDDGYKTLKKGVAPKVKEGLDFVRFLVPSYMYQMAAASLELGDGVFEESDLEYFEAGDGIGLNLTPNYEFYNTDYSITTNKDLVFGKELKGEHPVWPFFGVSSDGNYSTVAWSSGLVSPAITIPAFHSTYGAEVYIMVLPSTSAPYSAANVFSCVSALYMLNVGGWNNQILPITIDKNMLEEDWDNYFKVNYDITDPNCDINYIQSATGSVKSEMAGSGIPKCSIWEGYDVLYKNNVYSVVAAPYYALAVLVSADGKAKLAADQPFPASALGDKLFASQSDKYLSSVEFDDKGAIKTITFGIKLHYEGSDVAIKEFKEVFTADPATLTIDDFCGTYTQYSNLIEEDGTGIIPYMPINYYNSEVTISKISDTKVKISGIILSDFYSDGLKGAADAYIEAKFNPSTAMLEIPSQYVMSADGKDALYFEHPMLPGMKFFCYFQPGVTDYNQYSDKTYFGYLYEQTSDIGLAFNSDGQLELCPTKNTESVYAPDGYNIQFYVPDGQGGFALDEQYIGELYCTYAQTVLVPSGSASGIAPKAIGKKHHVSSSPRKDFTLKLK